MLGPSFFCTFDFALGLGEALRKVAEGSERASLALELAPFSVASCGCSVGIGVRIVVWRESGF